MDSWTIDEQTPALRESKSLKHFNLLHRCNRRFSIKMIVSTTKSPNYEAFSTLDHEREGMRKIWEWPRKYVGVRIMWKGIHSFWEIIERDEKSCDKCNNHVQDNVVPLLSEDTSRLQPIRRIQARVLSNRLRHSKAKPWNSHSEMILLWWHWLLTDIVRGPKIPWGVPYFPFSWTWASRGYSNIVLNIYSVVTWL